MKVGPSIPTRLSLARTDSGVVSGKVRLVETMLDRGVTVELDGTTPTQKELLQANLGRVDRGLLLWAEQQGVRLQVLQAGEELEETEALRDLTGRFEERMKPDTVEKFHEHLAPLTEKIRNEKDPEKALSLRRQKRNELAELLTLNPSGAAVYTPVFAPLLTPGLSSLPADPTETPTLKSMALHHGADLPREQEQFYRWMEKLNGDRLVEARQATIEERARLLESRPEARRKWLEQAKERPETVPLDTTLYTLVVPDAHFFPSRTGKEMLLDRSDLRSVEGWQNGDFRGQWFFLEGKTNLLIRDSALSLNTPVHELGHVIDMTLEKAEPEFYNRLSPRIEKAHYLARLHGHAISNYAMANTREYIAEGFAAYYDEPGRLRQTDPELHRLVEEMVEFCCKKAGADRTLDRKLQRMWQDAMAADPAALDPVALREKFEDQVRKVPQAAPLTQTAMATALSASQLGLLAGAAEIALGMASSSPVPEQTLADPVQHAYLEGIDAGEQRELFELGIQHGRAYFVAERSSGGLQE